MDHLYVFDLLIHLSFFYMSAMVNSSTLALDIDPVLSGIPGNAFGNWLLSKLIANTIN